MLFVCENNGYAVSFPRSEATAGSITGRAAAYGMPAVQVDGMDAEAVLEATADRGRARARRRRPGFLECATYRFVGHHTAERTMKLGYRSDEEIERWRERDPLRVLAERMAPADVAALDAEVEAAAGRRARRSRARARARTRQRRWTTCTPSGPAPRTGVAA